MVALAFPPRPRGFDARLAFTYQQAIRARAEVEQIADLVSTAARTLANLELADTPALSRLGLTSDQIDLVWAIVACSIDARLVPHLETIGGGHARRGLSVAVYAILATLEDESVARLSHWLAAGNPLVELGLIDAAEPVSPAARPYVATPRLIALLRDEECSIAPLRIVSAKAHLLHDPDQVETIAELRAALARSARPVLLLEGVLGSGRTTACACAAATDLIVLDLAQLAASELAPSLIALRRECLVRATIPVLANVDHLLGEDRRDERRTIASFIDHVTGPLFITTTIAGVELGARRAMVRTRWSVSGFQIREQLWHRAVTGLGCLIDGDVTTLAHRYAVGPGTIERAAASIELTHAPGSMLRETDLVHGLRHNISEQLAGLAQRVEVSQTWDDLVLSDDIRDLVAGLVGRVRHGHHVLDSWGYRKKIARGTGVAALFSGPPGTGKTMVAGLLAKELDLELYQVDLSKVVSKWVGETEKNLARVFDAAESGHGLLLFDEADSLFGQRSSDVQGANDRYANLEVNYLLQRVEAFGGITILTTNLDTAIDTALKRRLAAHIVFAHPDEDERAQLWERQVVTGEAPLADDLDSDELSRMFPKMSGANIRNAAISAAFLAAADGSNEISQAHLVRAARAEYRSMGHVIADMTRSL